MRKQYVIVVNGVKALFHSPHISRRKLDVEMEKREPTTTTSVYF